MISQPQAGILGTYAVVKRPWVIQDELGQDVIAIRPIMNLTLTYDHRLVDGALAGRFLRDLREKLESWDESDYWRPHERLDRAGGRDDLRPPRTAGILCDHRPTQLGESLGGAVHEVLVRTEAWRPPGRCCRRP